MEKRLAISAGVFSIMAALWGATAQAARVYPGCAAPPTNFNRIWYIDPVSGHAQTEGGDDGSQARPWNSLRAVFSPEKGYTAPLLSTVPYRQVPVPGQPAVYQTGPNTGPIRPGDEILLMSGSYGEITVGAWNFGVANASFLTIAAAPGQTPVFSSLNFSASSYFVFSGIKVQSLAGPTPRENRPLVQVVDHGPSQKSSNIVFTNMVVLSSDDTSSWTQEQWRTQARIVGFSLKGSEGGANTACLSVTNSHISNVIYGAQLMGNNTFFSDNEIDHFGDDGIDYSASNLLITGNYIHDNVDVGAGAHPDGMQGYPGSATNVVIDSNRVIRQTDPNGPFATWLQGIDAFDGNWYDLQVTNNVVVTSACWGIGYASVHGGRVINNTALSDDLLKMPGNCKPQVSVGDKSHDGSSSNDVVIRNNLANTLAIVDSDPNMVMDHNICLGIGGKCEILTYLDGKLQQRMDTPGTYGAHNVVDRRGAAGEFVNFDPVRRVFDLRLTAGATAIGTGNPDGAPRLDIAGAARGVPIDVGAYRFNPTK
jgi:Right handed beta helix region